jgi:hypothetical protein
MGGGGFSSFLGEGEEKVKLFRVFSFFVLPPQIAKIPPFKIQCSMIFIGKVLLGFQTSPSTFPFLLFSFFL